jgi:uncharacterized protein YndB with AHSA1/START domain
MHADGHAVLEDNDGRPALRFERVLAHSPERLWQALTTSEQLFDWHPTPFDLDPPAAGGRVRYRTSAEAPEMPDGRVLEYDPPRLLIYTWGEDELRWELRPHDDGCLLRLLHTFDDRFKAARDAAGWELCLEALESSLESEPHPRHGHGPRLPQNWKELNRGYEERFGIPPEKATPPPSV